MWAAPSVLPRESGYEMLLLRVALLVLLLLLLLLLPLLLLLLLLLLPLKEPVTGQGKRVISGAHPESNLKVSDDPLTPPNHPLIRDVNASLEPFGLLSERALLVVYPAPLPAP